MVRVAAKAVHKHQNVTLCSTGLVPDFVSLPVPCALLNRRQGAACASTGQGSHRPLLVLG